MATLAQFCLFSIFLFPLKTARGVPNCDTMSCGEMEIRFPFGLKGTNQSRRCSHPRFQLSCDKRGKTILTLPGSGDLVVKSINYEDQTVKVNDPNGCLPNRFLHNLSLSLSPPFTFAATVYDLTFFRCPSNITESYSLPPISCLSNSNSSSVIFSWWWTLKDTSPWHECEVISSAFVPIPNPNLDTSPFLPDLNKDIVLKWNEPACGECAARGQGCGFAGDKSVQVRCFSNSNKSQGLSRSAKYGLTIGVGIPGLLCLTGLCCFMCSKFNMYTHRHRARPINELPSSITTLQAPSFIMGLDGPEIEKFPKTLIGDSGRLPNCKDNMCPICLSEYEPKETLRTIPTCNHYFHAPCIDEWLKMNASCPLCRNSPDASSVVTPASSLSIHSSSP